MTTTIKKRTILSTGFAMFAMFFGAGNIVFPLALGQTTQDKNLWGILGMVITAVMVPLVGLLAMLLYEGNYRNFFARIGKAPGYLITLAILAVIGPFGGIPRCITISFSTLGAFGIEGIAGLNLITFSLATCAIIFVLVYKPNRILNVMGYVLTPILLLSLAIIAVKGVTTMPAADLSLQTRWQTFSTGFVNGYHTMDLLAAFFFSSVVLLCLRRSMGDEPSNKKRFLSVALYGSIIAATLLALVYVAFSFLAAGYSDVLADAKNHEMLGVLAYQMLGPYAGMVAGVAVTFACLTTEIALTVVFAEFLQKSICRDKISYTVAVLATLVVAFLISTLHFDGISAFLGPILQICYPALIVLTLLNLMNKLYGFKPVKPIFYTTLGIGALAHLL